MTTWRMSSAVNLERPRSGGSQQRIDARNNIRSKRPSRAPGARSGSFANREASCVYLFLAWCASSRISSGELKLARDSQTCQRSLMALLSFKAVNWSTVPSSPEEYSRELKGLETKLGAAQTAGARLDARWGRLRGHDVPNRGPWWLAGEAPDMSARLSQVQRAYADAEHAMRDAENALRPWLIRHRKPDSYPSGGPRRVVLRGAQIVEENNNGGIDLDTGELLPFLLAGRAQVAFKAGQERGRLPAGARALFAEGLCSSFEAYTDTRGGAALDEDAEPVSESKSDPELTWYLAAISDALPRDGKRAQHPKIHATVERAVALWEAGEKVVVFCHFRKTGRTLRRELSAAIDARLRQDAANAFKVPAEDIPRTVERLSERLYVRKGSTSALAREAQRQLAEIVARSRYMSDPQRDDLTDRFLRYLRSPVTLARYGAPLANGGADAVSAMLDGEQMGGETLRVRLTGFVSFFDSRTDREREELLEALGKVQSGRFHAEKSELEGEDMDEHEPAELLPTVRLANGTVRKDARRRLLLAFNSPLLPEILIASSVLAEGVDLHLQCRYVIHHDLDWSPSTLEQRTGRIDRIGSLAERHKNPVTIYLPYLAATQDEKMYRVVRDRERWFQVVMGGRHELDERALERLADRVPLPDEAAQLLALDLTVSK